MQNDAIKERKVNKIILTTTVMLLVMVLCLTGGTIAKTIVVNLMVHDMTEEEKDVLASRYPRYEEWIRRGKLFSSHYDTLQKIRFGMSYLEEKYPGYQFHMHSLSGWSGIYDECVVSEEISGEWFELHMYENEVGELVAEDNFYGYFLEEKYSEYLKEQLKEKFEIVEKVNVRMSYVEGRECDAEVSIEDILNRKINFMPSIHILLSAKDMAEVDCIQYDQKIRETIKDINLPGTYNIEFIGMTKEEMKYTEVYENFIYSSVLHWH